METDEQKSTSSEERGRIVGRRRRSGGRRADGARFLDAVEDMRHSIENVADDLRERVEEHPLKTLGMAVAAGYIVGGGLFTALTGRLLFGGLRIGVRLAALPLVRDEMLGFIETITDRGRGETERRQQ